jgi:nucleotide-binding universal stress UspA family protein
MTNNIAKILLATDGSEGSLRAARFAASIAGPHGAQITILTVHNEDALIRNVMGPTVLPATIPNSALNFEEFKVATEKQAASTILADTKAALGDFSNILVEQIWGQTAEAICNYARAKSIDLVIVGSRGRSAFARLLLGSVAMQVAEYSSCPVTIVR